jgi:cytoskeletal protein CcmA (bactofilin family)
MAVFSSDSDGQSGREGSLSIVAPGMRVVGELTTDGVVKVEGVVEGSVNAEREVLVAKGGTVQGDIRTRQAIIGGKVIGAIYAEERVEVQPDSEVHGDIATKRLTVHEGGEVNGQVRMGDAQPPKSKGAVAQQHPER